MAKIGSKVKFVDALKASDLPKPGKAISCTPGGLDVCIAVASDGLIYALGNKAPPTGSPLSDGVVSKDTIKDPQYGTEFSLKTGQVVGKWCPGGIGFLVGKLVGMLLELGPEEMAEILGSEVRRGDEENEHAHCRVGGRRRALGGGALGHPAHLEHVRVGPAPWPGERVGAEVRHHAVRVVEHRLPRRLHVRHSPLDHPWPL